MDGLLIDSEILWHEAEIEILGGLGVPLAAEGCRTTKGMFVGRGDRALVPALPVDGTAVRPRWP